MVHNRIFPNYKKVTFAKNAKRVNIHEHIIFLKNALNIHLHGHVFSGLDVKFEKDLTFQESHFSYWDKK